MVRLIRTTRWSPDTCECVIDFDWDDQAPDTVTYKAMIHKCKEHDGMIGNQLFSVVLDENQRRQKFISKALDLIATLRDDKTDENGNLIRTLKKEVKEVFFWTGKDKDRILHIKFKGASASLSAEQQQTLITAAKQISQKIELIG